MSINNVQANVVDSQSLGKNTQVQKEDSGFWGDNGLDFGDLIDVINPLQHIPIISSIYRNITGDEASSGARIIGGGLFGGIAGLMSSFFNATIEQETGKDMTGHAVAFFNDNSNNQLKENRQFAYVENLDNIDGKELSPLFEEVAGLPWLTEPLQVSRNISSYNIPASYSQGDKDSIDIII